MTASNEGVVAWQYRYAGALQSGTSIAWLECSEAAFREQTHAPIYEYRALVPAATLSALQAELDAARMKYGTDGEIIESQAKHMARLKAKHAALVAGVKGLASWLMEEAGSGYATGKPEIDNVTTAWASARLECADKLRALLAGRE